MAKAPSKDIFKIQNFLLLQNSLKKMSKTQQKSFSTYVSICPALWPFSAFIRVSAAAASSSAQLTEDVSLRSTSGSAKALPSAVDNLPIPSLRVNQSGSAEKE